MSAAGAKIEASQEPKGVGFGVRVSSSPVGGVWGGACPDNFRVFCIQTCIVVHISHGKIRNKLNR